MKKLKAMTRREALKIALLAGIIIAIAIPLCTGVINGLCFLWTAPLIMLADDGALEDWARKKLKEMEK